MPRPENNERKSIGLLLDTQPINTSRGGSISYRKRNKGAEPSQAPWSLSHTHTRTLLDQMHRRSRSQRQFTSSCVLFCFFLPEEIKQPDTNILCRCKQPPRNKTKKHSMAKVDCESLSGVSRLLAEEKNRRISSPRCHYHRRRCVNGCAVCLRHAVNS